jgi:ketosteroid isomerase-like protein
MNLRQMLAVSNKAALAATASIIAAALICAAIVQAAPQEMSNDEQTIRDLHKKIMLAVLKNDWKSVRPFLTDDYVFIHADGIHSVSVIDKTLQASDRPTVSAPEFEEEVQDARVRFSGDIAILTYAQTLRPVKTTSATTSGGESPSSSHAYLTIVWVKKPGGWKAMHAQRTETDPTESKASDNR